MHRLFSISCLYSRWRQHTKIGFQLFSAAIRQAAFLLDSSCKRSVNSLINENRMLRFLSASSSSSDNRIHAIATCKSPTLVKLSIHFYTRRARRPSFSSNLANRGDSSCVQMPIESLHSYFSDCCKVLFALCCAQSRAQIHKRREARWRLCARPPLVCWRFLVKINLFHQPAARSLPPTAGYRRRRAPLCAPPTCFCARSRAAGVDGKQAARAAFGGGERSFA